MGWEFSHPCFFGLKSVPSPRGRVVVVLETVSKATTTGGGIINYFVPIKTGRLRCKCRSFLSVGMKKRKRFPPFQFDEYAMPYLNYTYPPSGILFSLTD